MSIHLFKHNQQAYRAVTAMLEKEKMAAVIHPTGTGNLIAFKLAEENPSKHFLWLSPSEYIYQTQLGKTEYEISKHSVYVLQPSDERTNSIRNPASRLYHSGRISPLWRAGMGKECKKTSRYISKCKASRSVCDKYTVSGQSEEHGRRDFDGKIASEMTLGEAIVREILPGTQIRDSHVFLSKRTGTVKKTYPDFIESGTDHRKPEAA